MYIETDTIEYNIAKTSLMKPQTPTRYCVCVCVYEFMGEFVYANEIYSFHFYSVYVC